MIDPDNLERAAQSTVERGIKSFAEEVLQKKFEFHRRGLVQSSCFEQALGELALAKSQELAEDVANIIAQACGSDASQYVGILEKVYEKAKPSLLAYYRKNTIHDFNTSNVIRKIREPVERQIAENFASCANELRLGMVRGKAIVGNGFGNVNNCNIYGGTGIAIGSNNVAIHVGKGNLTQTVGWDRDALLQAIQGLCEALESEDIPLEAKENLNDEVVNLKREAEAEKPNYGRLKRIVIGLVARMEAFSIGVGSNLFVNHLREIMTTLRMTD